ncbi:uncharacterized protein LOC143242618 isoform X4 [Tachypleus tridentatus]|uniref:uncharacterized protein LOC143242618 isoform X4 n=1 Tax=Tachypleus tridentatus TaxID=6853 RepID=UPI003FD15C85
MFPCTPPAESARSNIAYLGMISQCLLIQNLLEGLKKVHSRCALLILGRTSQMNISCCFLRYDVRKMDFVLSVGRARQSNQLSE